jgi:protein-tyrosine-phosphatase
LKPGNLSDPGAIAFAYFRPTVVLAKQRVDWKIPNPRDMTPEQFREVRNLIETKVKELIHTL